MKYFVFSDRVLQLLIENDYKALKNVTSGANYPSDLFPSEVCFVYEANKESSDETISIYSEEANQIANNNVDLVRYLLQAENSLSQLLKSFGVEKIFEPTTMD